MKSAVWVAAVAVFAAASVPLAAEEDFFGGGGDTSKIVISAADAKTVAPPMRYGQDADAAKGRYLEIPDSGKGGTKVKAGVGHAEFGFEAKEAGRYYLHVRAWWPDACGNSVDVSINGKTKTVTDSTTKNWHWVKLPMQRFKIKKGRNTLRVINREDGARFDQVLLTTDDSLVPIGVEE